jgi:hypothetical protein
MVVGLDVFEFDPEKVPHAPSKHFQKISKKVEHFFVNLENLYNNHRINRENPGASKDQIDHNGKIIKT